LKSGYRKKWRLVPRGVFPRTQTALWTSSDSRSFGFLKNTKFGAKLSRKLVLHSLDSPCQVPDLEEALGVYGSAFVNVFPVYMRQAGCGEINPRAGNHPVLDRNVVEMKFLLGATKNLMHSASKIENQPSSKIKYGAGAPCSFLKNREPSE
jgi:hypothetical protein